MARSAWLALLAAQVALSLPLSAPPAQDSELLEEWALQRDLVLVDAAQRHYDVGLWCWEVGMRAQATSAMLYSLEVSDGRFSRARKTLAKMRALESDDWKKEPRRPNVALLRDHERRVRAAKDKDLREHLELARWAASKQLDAEAQAVYERLLQREGAPLELDEKGCLRIVKSVIRADFSQALYDAGVTIDGRRYVRDAFLRALPEVGAIFEAESDALRVRSTVGAEDARRLLALGLGLLPHLERDLGGRPTRRMELFVMSRRSDYERYLETAGLTGYGYGSGVADPSTFTAVVCAEGLEVDALALHELTHLFQFGISRAILPDWYEEGLAETFGGRGTFRLDGAKLEVGGELAPDLLALLADPAQLLTLDALLAADAATLFPDRGWLFYAQSWAFLRFMRSAAGADVAERFTRWERTCIGAALGADETDIRAGDPTAARALFAATFGGEVGELEARFRDYVAALD